MEEQLITFETAKLAYDIKLNGYNSIFPGFNYNENGELKGYSDKYVAPTQSLLQRWLREKHNIDVLIYKPDIGEYTFHIWGESVRQIHNQKTYE